MNLNFITLKDDFHLINLEKFVKENLHSLQIVDEDFKNLKSDFEHKILLKVNKTLELVFYFFITSPTILIIEPFSLNNAIDLLLDFINKLNNVDNNSDDNFGSKKSEEKSNDFILIDNLKPNTIKEINELLLNKNLKIAFNISSKNFMTNNSRNLQEKNKVNNFFAFISSNSFFEISFHFKHSFKIFVSHLNKVKQKVSFFLNPLSNEQQSLFYRAVNLNELFVDANGFIDSNIEKAEVNLSLQSLNIKGAKTTLNPYLQIKSRDVSAKHKALVFYPNNDILFYLKSKSLGKEDALRLYLESFLFRYFPEQLYELLKESLSL